MAVRRKSFKAPAFTAPSKGSSFNESAGSAMKEARVNNSDDVDVSRVEDGDQRKAKEKQTDTLATKVVYEDPSSDNTYNRSEKRGKLDEVLSELEIPEGYKVSKKSMMPSMNNPECPEISGVAGLSLTTPPTVRRKPMPTPKAPLKMRKQFDKNILKPKKLLYNDKEIENFEENDSGAIKTPMKKQKGQSRKSADDNSSNEQSQQKDKQVKSNLKSQGTKKKNSTITAEEIKKVKKSNINKEELNSNKENKGNFGRENDESKKKRDSDKSTSSGNKQIFYRGHFMKTDPKFSYLVNREDSTNSSELNRQPTDERGSRLYDVPLSQPPSNLEWLDHLKWLQARRDVGLWIECCEPTCGKWRYVDDIHDPLDVPKVWFCHMNSDKTLAACSAPERPFPPQQNADLIDNEYNAGSIVLAKVTGFPWWPAMVDDCPDVAQYYWLNGFSSVPTMYNVTFFHPKTVSRVWLETSSIQPFIGNKRILSAKTYQFHGTYTRKALQAAYRQAESALSFSIKERLEKYSFIARYEGPIGDPRKSPAVLKLTQEFLDNGLEFMGLRGSGEIAQGVVSTKKNVVLSTDKNKVPHNGSEMEKGLKNIRKQKMKDMETPMRSTVARKGTDLADANPTRIEEAADKKEKVVQGVGKDKCISTKEAGSKGTLKKRRVIKSIQNNIEQQVERSPVMKLGEKNAKLHAHSAEISGNNRVNGNELPNANTQMKMDIDSSNQEIGSEEPTKRNSDKSTPLITDAQHHIEANDNNDTCSIHSSIFNDSVSSLLSSISHNIQRVPTKKSIKSESRSLHSSHGKSAPETFARHSDNNNADEMFVDPESHEENAIAFKCEVDGDGTVESTNQEKEKTTGSRAVDSAKDKIENHSNIKEERGVDTGRFDTEAFSEDEICSSQSDQSSMPSRLSFILKDKRQKKRMGVTQVNLQEKEKHSCVTHASNASVIQSDKAPKCKVQITQADSTGQEEKARKIVREKIQTSLRAYKIQESESKKSHEMVSRSNKTTNVRKRAFQNDENDVPSTRKVLKMNTNKMAERCSNSRLAHGKNDYGKQSQSDSELRQSSSLRNKQPFKQLCANLNISYPFSTGTASQQMKEPHSPVSMQVRVYDDMFSESLRDICSENMRNFRAGFNKTNIHSNLVPAQGRMPEEFEKISKNLSMASSSEFVLLSRDSSVEDLLVSGVSFIDSMDGH